MIRSSFRLRRSSTSSCMSSGDVRTATTNSRPSSSSSIWRIGCTSRAATTRSCAAPPPPPVCRRPTIWSYGPRGFLRDESGIEAGADIAVEKRIPLGGGLGGGSSDAASTLVGLDRLWGLGMGADRLAALGVKLGADVPVFVRGTRGVGGGRRRASDSTSTLEQPWYVLLVLPFAVSTADVFHAPALTRNTPRIRMNDSASRRVRNAGIAGAGRAPARLALATTASRW